MSRATEAQKVFAAQSFLDAVVELKKSGLDVPDAVALLIGSAIGGAVAFGMPPEEVIQLAEAAADEMAQHVVTPGRLA